MALPGCVTRTFTVTSDPPGAEVRLDGLMVGTTPFEETFLSYGVREVDLRLPGYVRDVQPFELERPWWQYFPFDAFADLLWPSELNDDHQLAVTLVPRGHATGSWAEAHQTYADFKRLREWIRGRSLLFSGHAPPGSAPQVNPRAAHDPDGAAEPEPAPDPDSDPDPDPDSGDDASPR